jgi:hypothetical protein
MNNPQNPLCLMCQQSTLLSDRSYGDITYYRCHRCQYEYRWGNGSLQCYYWCVDGKIHLWVYKEHPEPKWIGIFWRAKYYDPWNKISDEYREPQEAMELAKIWKAFQ